MAETVNYCGTGGWSGPLPGDPDNYSVLSATPAFGGIDVSWTYPVINPSAVAHVLLYRGLSANFDVARQVAVVSGNFFYDKTTYKLPLEYFYWIQIVSINGTTGELIGPASATARPTIEQTLELLSGQIDAGALAQSLKSEIDNITLLGQSITQEVAERIAANLALGGALTDMQTDVGQAITIIEAVNKQRITDNDALASSLTLVAAGLGDSIAGVAEEFDAYASPDGVIAKFKNTTEATLNGNTTTGQVGLISTVSEQGDSLDSAYTAKLTANGLVGGFGIRNDGAAVEAGFDVDTFWVGRTGANKRKPFIISGGETFIDQAVINQLTFDKLRAADGSLIVANGKVQATYVEAQTLQIKNAAGTVVLEDGSGTFSGALSAVSGTLGALTINVGGNVKSGQTSYNSGTGFFLGYNGATPVFSIGNPAGSHMKWDGTDLYISRPTLEAFSASIPEGDLNVRGASGGYIYGTRTASVVGGKPGYTYFWVFDDKSGYIVTGQGTPTITIGGSEGSMDYAVINSGTVACLVRDANGRIAVASFDFTALHAAQPNSGGA